MLLEHKSSHSSLRRINLCFARLQSCFVPEPCLIFCNDWAQVEEGRGFSMDMGKRLLECSGW